MSAGRPTSTSCDEPPSAHLPRQQVVTAQTTQTRSSNYLYATKHAHAVASIFVKDLGRSGRTDGVRSNARIRGFLSIGIGQSVSKGPSPVRTEAGEGSVPVENKSSSASTNA
jgi:hypothetical protein